MKKIRYIILTILLLLPTMVSALELDGIYSKHVIIYNRDENKIIYEKNADEKTSIASLTKIMTTLIAIENIKDLSEEVTISYKMLEKIPWDASTAGLEVGDVVTYKDLLYAIMLPSGADATDSIAISLFGSTEVFVEKMNEKAKELKLDDTHFADTSGYDETDSYSTAKNVLSLLNYALDNETFKEIYNTKKYTLSNGLEVKTSLENMNKKYNYDLSFVLGNKTGTNENAGLCLSTLSVFDNTNIITITINSPYSLYLTDGKSRNLEDLITIHDALEEQYASINLVEEGETLTKLETKYAKEKNIKILSTDTITRYLEKTYDEDLLEVKYIGEEVIKNTTKKGTKVGKFEVYYDDELIDTVGAITANNLTFSVWAYLKTNIFYYIILIMLILGTFKIIKTPKNKRK